MGGDEDLRFGEEILHHGEDAPLPGGVEVDVNLVEEKNERAFHEGDVVLPGDPIEAHHEIGDPAQDGLEAIGEEIEANGSAIALTDDLEQLVADIRRVRSPSMTPRTAASIRSMEAL